MAKRSAPFRLSLQHVGFALVLVAAVVVMVVSSLKSRTMTDEQLQKVIDNLRAGATTLPADGRLLLQGSDIRLTEDGVAYVTGSPPAYVLFADWRGPGTRLSGVLWSSTPLVPGQEVEILVPRTLSANDPVSERTLGPTTDIAFWPTTVQPVRVRAERRPGWYDVERRE